MNLEPLAKPHLGLAAPPAHSRNIDRKYDETERDHPETKNGQKAQKPKENEHHADRNSYDPVFRQIEISVPELDFGHGLSNIGSRHHPQERGT